MSKYTKEELKDMAKIIMFNPNSTKSVELVNTIVFSLRISPQEVYQRIQEFTQGEELKPYVNVK